MVALLVLCLYPGAAVKRAPSGNSVKKTHSKPKAKAVEGGKKGSSPRPVPEPASPAPEPPRPAPKAPQPPPILKSGDMTVNVRLKDGSLYPVPVNASAGMLGFRQQVGETSRSDHRSYRSPALHQRSGHSFGSSDAGPCWKNMLKPSPKHISPSRTKIPKDRLVILFTP